MTQKTARDNTFVWNTDGRNLPKGKHQTLCSHLIVNGTENTPVEQYNHNGQHRSQHKFQFRRRHTGHLFGLAMFVECRQRLLVEDFTHRLSSFYSDMTVETRHFEHIKDVVTDVC